MAKQKSERPARAARPPEKKIGPFTNGIGVAIWINEIQTLEGKRRVRSITINPRRYFDRESADWKDATSFQPADLPALIYALTKALEFSFEVPLPELNGSDRAIKDEAGIAEPLSF